MPIASKRSLRRVDPPRRERDAMPEPGAGPPAHRTLPCDDRERLGDLLSRLEPRLTAVALRITRNGESARDVVQNAFEKVLRNPWQFRGQARVSTWMHRIVVNEALMWLRSEGRRARRVADLDGILGAKLRDPCPTPLELLTQREHQGRLRAGIAALSPEEQEVLEQCAVEGLSYAELSERTGVHPGALKSRAFRARRRLSLLVGEA